MTHYINALVLILDCIYSNNIHSDKCKTDTSHEQKKVWLLDIVLISKFSVRMCLFSFQEGVSHVSALHNKFSTDYGKVFRTERLHLVALLWLDKLHFFVLLTSRAQKGGRGETFNIVVILYVITSSVNVPQHATVDCLKKKYDVIL